MPTPRKDNEVRISLRLPADLHKLLADRSEKDLRSLNAEILFLLREALKQ